MWNVVIKLETMSETADHDFERSKNELLTSETF